VIELSRYPTADELRRPFSFHANLMLNALFVYGTLKQGHLRSSMWPHAPHSIVPAVVRGKLLDLGAYPGLIPGDDWVLGELWSIAAEHTPRTLEVLDQVEGYDPSSDRGLDLRRTVSVWPLASLADSHQGSPAQAYTYLIADEHFIASARHITPAIPIGELLAAQWPDPLSRVPKRLEDE